MRFSQLSTVKHRVQVGAPLPFNVRDVDRTLLLARGQVVDSHEQMEALFTRGALVDIAELLTPAQTVLEAPPQALPGLWRDGLDQVSNTLMQGPEEGFGEALDQATPAVVTLIERDKDLAIFQVMRQEHSALIQYGVNHAMHAAITAFLVARRLRWTDSDIQRLFKVALTMNISMFELQGQLAVQDSVATQEQLEAVRAHPEFSVRMLELSGVDDAEWLRAVAQHHEQPDGSGYPYGVKAVSDIAALVRRADIYTTMLSGRRGRPPISADRASRAMFMNDPDNPMTAALVKEFGVYPPGCFVQLSNGERGVVVRRGPTVVTPVVAAMVDSNGQAYSEPVRRDSALPEYAIVAIVPASDDLTRASAAQLMALCGS